jgi:hypothetical protein
MSTGRLRKQKPPMQSKDAENTAFHHTGGGLALYQLA